MLRRGRRRPGHRAIVAHRPRLSAPASIRSTTAKSPVRSNTLLRSTCSSVNPLLELEARLPIVGGDGPAACRRLEPLARCRGTVKRPGLNRPSARAPAPRARLRRGVPLRHPLPSDRGSGMRSNSRVDVALLRCDHDLDRRRWIAPSRSATIADLNPVGLVLPEAQRLGSGSSSQVVVSGVVRGRARWRSAPAPGTGTHRAESIDSGTAIREIVRIAGIRQLSHRAPSSRRLRTRSARSRSPH